MKSAEFGAPLEVSIKEIIKGFNKW